MPTTTHSSRASLRAHTQLGGMTAAMQQAATNRTVKQKDARCAGERGADGEDGYEESASCKRGERF